LHPHTGRSLWEAPSKNAHGMSLITGSDKVLAVKCDLAGYEKAERIFILCKELFRGRVSLSSNNDWFLDIQIPKKW
jgi:hypothetical protein